VAEQAADGEMLSLTEVLVEVPPHLSWLVALRELPFLLRALIVLVVPESILIVIVLHQFLARRTEPLDNTFSVLQVAAQGVAGGLHAVLGADAFAEASDSGVHAVVVSGDPEGFTAPAGRDVVAVDG
jgi:hypothetical protein